MLKCTQQNYNNVSKDTERPLGENIHISYLHASNVSDSCFLCICWWMESQVCVRPALLGPLISVRLGCNILIPLAPFGSLWRTSEPLMMNVSHEWGNVKRQLAPNHALALLLQYTHLLCSSSSCTGTIHSLLSGGTGSQANYWSLPHLGLFWTDTVI